MATKRITDLTEAGSIQNADYLHIVQGGIDKKAPVSGLGISDKASTADLTAEATARANADTAEATARANADSQLKEDLAECVAHQSVEESKRKDADDSLREAIDALVSPSGQSVVVDKSLSISGAAADAAVTGNNLSAVYASLVNMINVSNTTLVMTIPETSEVDGGDSSTEFNVIYNGGDATLF